MGRRWSAVPTGNLVLVSACLALGGAVYAELEREPAEATADIASVAGAAEPGPVAQTDTARHAFRPAPLSAYGEIVARPLFNRSRRPGADKTDTPATGGAGAPAVRLVGIVVDADGATAFVKTKDAPEIVRVSPGAAVDGWIVRSIERDGVTLAKNNEVARLSIKDEQPRPESADRSADKRKPTVAGGTQERPGQERNDKRD
jgi:hypothetical protein